jgi:hypothetical protein
MTDLELFHVDERIAEPVESLSADRRRTLRQRADVDRGVHPLMGGKARPELGTCGSCANRVKNHRGFPKCEVGPRTFSASTDVRAWWPACDLYEAKR